MTERDAPVPPRQGAEGIREVPWPRAGIRPSRSVPTTRSRYPHRLALHTVSPMDPADIDSRPSAQTKGPASPTWWSPPR